MQRIFGAENCNQFWEPPQSTSTYKHLKQMTFSDSGSHKKIEFRVIRRLTSRLFNSISIKSSFWPLSGRFLQILISTIDSLELPLDGECQQNSRTYSRDPKSHWIVPRYILRVNESKHFFSEDVAPRLASNHGPLYGNYGNRKSQQVTEDCTLTLA